MAEPESLEDVAREIDAEAPDGLMDVWGEGLVPIRVATLRKLRRALGRIGR